MIPYGRQDITEEDVQEVVEVLKSDFLTQGPKVPQFEKKLAQYCGVNHSFALNSATSALHVACMALGLTKGDWLWTSPITFVASANVGIYCGANIDFVDIDAKTNNLCPQSLEIKLTQASSEGKLPKILIPVHLGGQPCDMKAIKELCNKYNVKIIEDASHAIGGKYLDKPIGSCQYSDVSVFSFHPVKIITTGEGGVLLTNNSKIAEKAALHRSHGITREQKLMTEPSHGDWYYQQIDLGYNYRMTELQAALGISQMKRLDEFVSLRHKVSDRYDLLLKDLPVQIPTKVKKTYSGMHLYIIRLNLEEISASHKEVFKGLRENGIGVNLHYIPVHMQPFYKSMGFNIGDFPESEKYYSEAISLPMFPHLSEKDQLKVADVLSSKLFKE